MGQSRDRLLYAQLKSASPSGLVKQFQVWGAFDGDQLEGDGAIAQIRYAFRGEGTALVVEPGAVIVVASPEALSGGKRVLVRAPAREHSCPLL